MCAKMLLIEWNSQSLLRNTFNILSIDGDYGCLPSSQKNIYIIYILEGHAMG